MNGAFLDVLTRRCYGVMPGLRPFYRRYPYSGGVSQHGVDARGCIDLDVGFFYNRMPKAANSTVVSNLASAKLQRDVGSREAKGMFMRPSTLSVDEVDKLDNVFAFTVVRDPFKRTLSAFLDKVQRKQDLGTWRGQKHDFASFLRWLDKGALHSNGHWAPQSSMLLLPLQRLDFIGKVESLDQDLDAIMAALKLRTARTDVGEVKSIWSNKTGANDKLSEYYDASTRAMVLKLYAQDFENFGYEARLH